MKKYVLLTVTSLALAAASQASAQTAPAAPAPGAAMSAAPGGNEVPFPQRKAKVLENMQKKMACVQAAQNREQMHACFPEARQGMMGGQGGMPPGGAPQH